MPRVEVLSTGGTIASTDQEGGAAPTESGEALVEAVPGLDEHATVSVTEVCQRHSANMDTDAVAAVARAVRESDADGVVVTHGTDTMEESAYYLDLVLDDAVPVVFTGAQRRPDEVSPDGPANLRTAVRAAVHDRIDAGVFVAFDDELHAARDVTKAHTSKLGTFESPGKGPLGLFTREGVEWYREPRSYSASVDALETDATVPIVPSACGVGRGAVDDALDRGADGLVLAATGLGNARAVLGEAVADAVEGGTPVVVASRCHAGPTAAVYGSGGGGRQLASAGARFAGDLPPWKARLKLMLGVAAGADLDALFE
ncbi:MAG: asparaginase [Haloarculaceae archaeon]